MLSNLMHGAGSRWHIEEGFEEAKGEGGWISMKYEVFEPGIVL